MSRRIRSNQPLIPSLLDRLIDDKPEHSLESVPNFSKLLKDIKANIRRDLENLLNTRLYHFTNMEKYPELAQSAVNYGLPDFSHIQFDNDDARENFRCLVEDTITRFEPRFQRVIVDIVPVGSSFERVLHLKISAVLMVEPDPVPLIFDTKVRPSDRTLTLQELAHG